MQTTAKYPNRLEDKKNLEKQFPLLTEFSSAELRFGANNKLVALNYNRVVYGDHGPYIEFEFEHFQIPLVDFNGNIVNETLFSSDAKPDWFYIYVTPRNNLEIKIYWQMKSVHFLRNAPTRADGKLSKFNRSEGYADYKVGKFYIDPYVLQIK